MPTDDDDLKDVNPGFPKAAAGFTLLAGAMGILTGLHTVLSVRIFSHVWAGAPYVLIVLGLALGFFARNLYLARSWAAVGGMAVGLLMAAASASWLFFSVTNGLIVLMAIWTPPGALLAVALCAAALTPCRRAEEARQRLAAQGLDLGL
ncbi:MAG TPA: hypothetical protein VGI39_18210 [Polyangiaceae bacterium]|jgi:hypothetical protein